MQTVMYRNHSALGFCRMHVGTWDIQNKALEVKQTVDSLKYSDSPGLLKVYSN